MKRFMVLLMLLLIVSSCTMFPQEEQVEEDEEEVEEEVIPDRDFGPVTPSDKEIYFAFQVRVVCGEDMDKLLLEYDMTMARIVEISRTMSNETIIEVVSKRIIADCPDRVESLEPSIGTVE